MFKKEKIVSNEKMQFLAQRLLSRYKISCKDVCSIIEQTQITLSLEPNVLSIHAPTYIVGSLNGQFDDLLSIFEIGGPLPYSSYIFLGNYTGLSTSSLNTVLLLFAYKVLYKEQVFLIRGNKEDITKIGDKKPSGIPPCAKHPELDFISEVLNSYKFDEAKKIIDKISDAFKTLPIAAIVSQMYFCVSYGLVMEDNTMKKKKPDDSTSVGKSFCGIDHLRRIQRTVSFNDNTRDLKNFVRLPYITRKFLKKNRMSFIITTFADASNLVGEETAPNQYCSQVYSNFGAYRNKSVKNETIMKECFVIELNENKVLRKIKMKRIKDDDIYNLPSLDIIG